jgi:Mlc titration factor MtfA (ptsG expression regulator)
VKVALILIVFLILGFIIREIWSKNKWKSPKKSFPSIWQKILLKNVNFYFGLDALDQKKFEYKVQEFLLNVRITGVDTEVDETDKLLIASSAVIPIFEFPNWKYTNLFEVLLYSSAFNEKFQTKGEERSILGMVGTGYMNGKMILSKQALKHGFENETDKKNTAIHEFVHLLDKSDGVIDGIPNNLMQKQYVIPWIDLMNQEMDAIYARTSDINPYGGTNKSEFFAVASEYFFERPKLMAQKHPKLYSILEHVFNSDMTERNLKRQKQHISRNDDCPCGSLKKFKHCCGETHYTRK